MIVVATKRCSTCRQCLPLSEFHSNASKPDGLGSACKGCQCEAMRSHWRRNADRYRAKRYGVSVELVGALLSIPCCQACGEIFSDFGKERIDHCHDHSHVRGVLCQACNLAIQGSASEALSRLRGCIAYLERDLGWQSLEVSCPG